MLVLKNRCQHKKRSIDIISTNSCVEGQSVSEKGTSTNKRPMTNNHLTEINVLNRHRVTQPAPFPPSTNDASPPVCVRPHLDHQAPPREAANSRTKMAAKWRHVHMPEVGP